MAVVMVVEDGTGVSGANSYASLVDLKAYWDNMGYDYSALTDDQISILLIKSAKILDGTYGNKYPGNRGNSTQGLQWPRSDASYLDGYTIASTVVPEEIAAAVSEIAYAINSGTDLQPIDTKSNIQSYSVAVEGAVTEATVYKTSGGSVRPVVTAAKDALFRLISFVKYGYAGSLRM